MSLDLMFGCMLPQNDVENSHSFLKMLGFLPTQCTLDSLHWDFGSIAYCHLKRFWLKRTPCSLHIILVWAALTSCSHISKSRKMRFHKRDYKRQNKKRGSNTHIPICRGVLQHNSELKQILRKSTVGEQGFLPVTGHVFTCQFWIVCLVDLV